MTEQVCKIHEKDQKCQKFMLQKMSKTGPKAQCAVHKMTQKLFISLLRPYIFNIDAIMKSIKYKSASLLALMYTQEREVVCELSSECTQNTQKCCPNIGELLQ